MRTRPGAGALIQLLVGLVLFGISLALLVRADLGLAPWDVFHQGLAERTGFSLGTLVIAVSVAVLALWIPLRQRPGIGTLANALLVGLVVDAALVVLPFVDGTAARIALLVGGVLLNALATGLYIVAGLGPGPRDGLMTGLASDRRSIRLVRTGIEVVVLLAGWLLGGSVGIGTALFALGIGPLTQPALHRFDRRPAPAAPPPGCPAPGAGPI
ncbi:membrane protein [soil metagenome]